MSFETDQNDLLSPPPKWRDYGKTVRHLFTRGFPTSVLFDIHLLTRIGTLPTKIKAPVPTYFFPDPSLNYVEDVKVPIPEVELNIHTTIEKKTFITPLSPSSPTSTSTALPPVSLSSSIASRLHSMAGADPLTVSFLPKITFNAYDLTFGGSIGSSGLQSYNFEYGNFAGTGIGIAAGSLLQGKNSFHIKELSLRNRHVSAVIGHETDNGKDGFYMNGSVRGSRFLSVGAHSHYTILNELNGTKQILIDQLGAGFSYNSRHFDLSASLAGHWKDITRTLRKTLTFNGLYRHSKDLQLASEVILNVGPKSKDRSMNLVLGGSYRLEDGRVVKGKVDTSGLATVSYAQKLNSTSRLTVAADTNLIHYEFTPFRFGFSLSFEA